jgi:hypothetical protein
MTDRLIISAVRGRVGVAVLSMVGLGLTALGYDFNADMQTQFVDIVVGLITGISSLLSIYSKVRESRNLPVLRM